MLINTIIKTNDQFNF